MFIPLRIAGCLWLAFAVFHAFFPQIFDWNTQLPLLTGENENIVRMLAWCWVPVMAGFGFITLRHVRILGTTPMGRDFCLLMVMFWLCRSVLGLIYDGLSPSEALFLGMAACYFMPLIKGRAGRG